MLAGLGLRADGEIAHVRICCQHMVYITRLSNPVYTVIAGPRVGYLDLNAIYSMSSHANLQCGPYMAISAIGGQGKWTPAVIINFIKRLQLAHLILRCSRT